MKSKLKPTPCVSEIIPASSGSRDAVETAIDFAKDGAPWEGMRREISPWPLENEEDDGPAVEPEPCEQH